MSASTESKPAGKSPTHVAYVVRDREGQKSYWTRTGVAWSTPMAKASTSSSNACP
jgi:hypothetical protein